MNTMIFSRRIVGCVLLAGFCSVSAADFNYVPPGGVVSNAAVAGRIAEAILSDIYGEEEIRKQLPFKVELLNDVWHVSGAWQTEKLRMGGVAEIWIRKTDSAVLRITHGM